MRILFIEHHKEVAAFFACLIQEEGYELILAGSETDLDALLKRNPPDLILMEGAFRSLDAIEFSNNIKKGDYGLKVAQSPIIVVDSFGVLPMAELKEPLENELISKYFIPPIRSQDVLSSIREKIEAPTNGSRRSALAFRFKNKNLPKLILTAYHFSFSGKMTLTRGDISKNLYFKEGKVVSASSTLTTDRIGNLLITKGLLEEGDLNKALIKAGDESKMIGQVLLENGIIDPADLMTSLVEQSEMIALSQFEWESFEVSFSGEYANMPPDVILPIHPFELVRSGIGSELVQSQISEILPASGWYLIPNIESPIGIADIRFSEKEKETFDLIDGRISIRDIQKQSRLPEYRCRQLLSLLVLTGIVRISRTPFIHALKFDALPKRSRSDVIFKEAFFASDTVPDLANQPPPITQSELDQTLAELEAEEAENGEVESAPALEDIDESEVKGIRVTRGDPVRYLVSVTVILAFLATMIAVFSIYSRKPHYSDQKNVQDTGGDLKPLFTKAIDLYNAGLNHTAKGDLKHLVEAEKCFKLALEIVPNYNPALTALEDVEKKIEKLKQNAKEKKQNSKSTTPGTVKE